MIKYVYAVEFFPNCPVHGMGIFNGLKTAENLDEICEYALINLNEFHITDVIDIKNTENNIDFEYFSETHRYSGIILYLNSKKIKYTGDNGSGKLMWFDS